jgi:ketosteroid isomerase-like protein
MSEPHTGSATERAGPPPRRRKGLIAIIAAAVVLVVASIAVGALLLLRPAKGQPNAADKIRTVVGQFYDYVQGGDLAKTKTVVCDEIIKNRYGTTTDAQFAAKHKASVEETGRFTVDQFEDVKVSGDRAMVTYTGHNTGGNGADVGAERLTIGLRNVGESWKVCKFPAADSATEAKKRQAADKAEIRSAIERYYELVKKGNRKEVAFSVCSELARGIMQIPDDQWNSLKDDDETIKSIDDITIQGESAKVTLTESTKKGSTVATWTVDREISLWKPCAVKIVGG